MINFSDYLLHFLIVKNLYFIDFNMRAEKIKNQL